MNPLARVLAYLINQHIYFNGEPESHFASEAEALADWYWDGFIGLADVVWEAMNS
jgi:hypothetical protein